MTASLDKVFFQNLFDQLDCDVCVEDVQTGEIVFVNGHMERSCGLQSVREKTRRSEVISAWEKRYGPFADTVGRADNGSSHDDRNDDFWEEVRDTIKNAEPGDIIKVKAGSYEKMPCDVMDELRVGDANIVIQWNGGADIIIPAGQALNETLRIYHPLSYLAEYGFEAGSGKLNPETGGVMEVVVVETAGTHQVVTDARRGLAETRELAHEEVERTIPGIDEPQRGLPDTL